MASEAKNVWIDDSEAVDLTTLEPAERAMIEAALGDADHGRWVDHSVIKADIAVMRAKVRTHRAEGRIATRTR